MEKDIIRKTRRYNNYLIAVSGKAITAANKFDVLPTDVNSISKRFVVIN